MQKVLIADISEEFTAGLAQLFCKSYQVKVCHDGITASELLASWQPDIMILDLSLPQEDGMYILQNAGYIPPVVLAVSTFVNAYVLQVAKDCGVGYMMTKPCRVNAVFARVEDMVRRLGKPAPADPQEVAARHLQAIRIPATWDGFQQLRIGLPLFMEDPTQILSKELYPNIATLCDITDGRAVERSIRAAIQEAWMQRDPAIWGKYFSPDENGAFPCPTNKEFILRMTQILQPELSRTDLTNHANPL